MKNLFNALRVLVCIIFVVQAAGCGTLMYPERKGQKSGKIDSGVAILDGIGLLFFLIPGIIAFVVDFNNGTIYLPGTSRASVDSNDIRQVKFDPKQGTMAGLQKILKEEIGQDITLDRSDVMITKL